MARTSTVAARVLRQNFNLVFLTVLHLGFYVFFFKRRIILVDEEYTYGAVLVVSCLASLLLLNALLSYLRPRVLRASVNFAVLTLFLVFLGYHATRRTALDFNLVSSNYAEMLAPESRRLIFQAGGPAGWLALGAGVLLLALFEVKFHALSDQARPRRPVRTLSFLLAANVFFVVAFDQNPQEGFAFVKSALRYYSSPEKIALENARSREPFPFARRFTPSRAGEQRPHVFLLFMESFNAEFIEKRTADGRELTPFLNSLVGRAIYHDRFFSNSMQTERGQVATLCSVIPSIRGKMMQAYFGDRLRCLPEILAENGYRTVFSGAQSSLAYDNTGNFMRKIGFQRTTAMTDELLSGEERRHVWGWGLQDDVFFRKTFAALDPELREGRPLFVALATISNHQPFTEMPPDQRRLYPAAGTFNENFQNSVHLADGYLRAFFDALETRGLLEKSLVILLGDHGMVTGLDGNTSNEKSAAVSLFRIPLFVFWQGRSWRNREIAYSQLDLAPSILEWLGIAADAHFAGQAIPAAAEDLPREQHLIPLVQPYDGIFLMSLLYPLKYGYNIAADEERLYDLDRDPGETRNIIKAVGPAVADPLRSGLETIFLNQRLLNENRLFPALDARR